MANLVKSSVTCLQKLKLDKLILGLAEIGILQLSHWPNLKAINLSCNTAAYLTAETRYIVPFVGVASTSGPVRRSPRMSCTACVRVGQWPLLQILILSGSLFPAGSVAESRRAIAQGCFRSQWF